MKAVWRFRAIILGAGIIIALAIVIIIVILDSATTSTVNTFVATDQFRTSEFSAHSILSRLRNAAHMLKFGYGQVTTGLGDCATMDGVVLNQFFESQISVLRVGVVIYLYVSEMFNTSQWWDCNCAFDGEYFVCSQPWYDSDLQKYVLRLFSFPANVAFPLNMVVNDTLTEDYSGESYIHSIMELPSASSETGAWLKPFVSLDPSNNKIYSALTLSIPLAHNGNITTKAISIDMNVTRLNTILNHAKPHESTLLFIYDVRTRYIIASSDLSLPPWDASLEFYTVDNHPSTIIRETVQELMSRQNVEAMSDSSWLQYSMYSERYKVGAFHYQDRNLHHIVFEITPRTVFFSDIETSRVTSISIGSSVGAFALIGVLVLIYYNIRMHRAELSNYTRDISNAPTQNEAIFVMFTDIQGSSRLWGAKPKSMHKAVQQHHEVIRDLIRKYNAYEVKTVGDSFMVVAKDSKSIVEIANGIHMSMNQIEWDEDLLEEPDAAVEQDDKGVTLFRGLRVRIGIHYGTPTVFWDKVAKGYDYYGECVNIAARLESTARSGVTVISDAVLQELPELYVQNECVVRNLGVRVLKGVRDVVQCYSIASLGILSDRPPGLATLDSTPTSPLHK
eukprot:PhF_6_TR29122/c0_g1_i1/m.42508